MRIAEDAPEDRHPAEAFVLLEATIALHAAVELRAHAQGVAEAALEPARHAARGHAVVQQLAGSPQQAVDRVGPGTLLHGPVGQLAEVPGRGGRLELVAQAQPGVGHVDGGDDVEVAPTRQHEVQLGEGLHAATDPAALPAHPLGDGPQLAVLGRQQRDDAVRLAEVEVGEDDGTRLVGPGAWHSASLSEVPRQRAAGPMPCPPLPGPALPRRTGKIC